MGVSRQVSLHTNQIPAWCLGFVAIEVATSLLRGSCLGHSAAHIVGNLEIDMSTH